MEIILREDVPNLGATGDVVKVKPGFARNYLFPRGLAVMADHRNVRELEHQKRAAQQKREKDRLVANSAAERLNKVRLTFTARASEEGKLFGSITNIDIERALTAQGVSVDRRRIRLDEPIRALGESKVTIALASGVAAEITVEVRGEGEPAAGA
jgi:large subunit ribosomal protein L9